MTFLAAKSKYSARAILLAALVSGAGCASSGDSQGHGTPWNRLIQTMEGDDCPVEVIETIVGPVGTNGFTINRWVVSTCHGVRMYRVKYSPTENPMFTVERISPCVPERPACQ